MYFAYCGLAVVCVVLLVNVQANINDDQEEDGEDDLELDIKTNHTFVALIDIVFTDDTKRTCTGAIIHENVVITAAHCFEGNDQTSASKPELTASFVVVGTKIMFDTGYEQYLPIEKILIHPKYEGWTADLALVFTFAGMTSDKPGTVIPLADDKVTMQLDSNVTVFSWGHTRSKPKNSLESQKEQKASTKQKKNKKKTSEESCESDQMDGKIPNEYVKVRATRTNSATALRNNFRHEDDDDDNTGIPLQKMVERPQKNKNKHKNQQIRAKDVEEPIKFTSINRYSSKEKTERPRKYKPNYENQQNRAKEDEDEFTKPTSVNNHYLSLAESFEHIESSIKPYVFGTNASLESIENLLKTITTKYLTTDHKTTTPIRKRERKRTTRNPATGYRDFRTRQVPYTIRSRLNIKGKKNMGKNVTFKIRSNKSWRRYLGILQNRLLIENFGFVNIHSCKALVEKALPSKYNISRYNDVICYSNMDRCVDENDSGAPAVRQGRLVAITLGGAECEGDHVTIGMRMACYCSWISDNLPPGSRKLSCCKDCCDVKHKEEKRRKDRRLKLRNTKY